MSGIVPLLEAPSNYDPVFANNTWEQIIEVCQKNKVPDTWVVGDKQAMTINGSVYTIDIIGKNHDTYSDGSGTAPLTFMSHEVYSEKSKMYSSLSNSGGWGSCIVRTEMLPTILSKMPSVVQSAIKAVDKKTSSGNSSSIINTTSDKLFLPSEIEVFGEKPHSYAGEGSQYEYFKNGGSYIKSDLSGTNVLWWERSPSTDSSGWCFVGLDTGFFVGAQAAGPTNNWSYPFAFCF